MIWVLLKLKMKNGMNFMIMNKKYLKKIKMADILTANIGEALGLMEAPLKTSTKRKVKEL